MFVVNRLGGMQAGNVATKQYANAVGQSHVALGPKASAPPTSDGSTLGDTQWDDSGVYIWNGNVWQTLSFVRNVFELDASLLRDQLGADLSLGAVDVRQWPSSIDGHIAVAHDGTPPLQEDEGVPFVRLGVGLGNFRLEGFSLDNIKGTATTLVVRNHSST